MGATALGVTAVGATALGVTALGVTAFLGEGALTALGVTAFLGEATLGEGFFGNAALGEGACLSVTAAVDARRSVALSSSTFGWGGRGRKMIVTLDR